MAVQKLKTTDAFVIVDFPDAPASGVVRRARKILQSSASDLARSASYTFATFGIERSGASAGINAEGDDVAPAIDAFVTELEPRAASGELRLIAGKGVEPGQLERLRAAEPDGAGADPEQALVAGVVAAAGWAAGGSLAGKSVAIEGHTQAPAGLRPALDEAGATVVDVWGIDEKPWLIWGADVDVVFAGSKPGVLSHQGAGMVSAKAIVPWGPIPLTTKAFAQLHRGGKVELIPDFVATAGPLLTGVVGGDGAAAIDAACGQIVEVLGRNAGHADGLFLGSCYQAEEFFLEWHGKKPFGRPLAA